MAITMGRGRNKQFLLTNVLVPDIKYYELNHIG